LVPIKCASARTDEIIEANLPGIFATITRLIGVLSRPASGPLKDITAQLGRAIDIVLSGEDAHGTRAADAGLFAVGPAGVPFIAPGIAALGQEVVAQVCRCDPVSGGDEHRRLWNPQSTPRSLLPHGFGGQDDAQFSWQQAASWLRSFGDWLEANNNTIEVIHPERC
jgi:hypothetical protein